MIGKFNYNVYNLLFSKISYVDLILIIVYT